MQLTKVSVRSLFARFDHEIPVNQDEKITIITAPNGHGKTVLLNIITRFFTKNFHRLLGYDFDFVEFSFEGNRKIVVHGRVQDDLFDSDHPGPSKELRFEPINFPNEPDIWTFKFQFERLQKNLERYLPFIERIGIDRWMDERTGDSYSTVEVIDNFADMLPSRVRRTSKVPDWLDDVISATECHLIETQRLLRMDSDTEYQYHREPRRSQSVVERNANNLSKHIGDALQNYANDAQKLDQSFPKRVLQQLSTTAPPEDSIRERLKSLDVRRSQLVSAGLLDKSFSQQISAADLISDDNIRNILAVYTSDTEQKLSVFEDIYAKINLFKEIMTGHFTYKEMKINGKNGIQITDNAGNNIPLNALSSGEQHELVLIYELLFQVSANTLILIDEPELSLHVAWQKRFISDIQEIQKLRPLTVIMATHSPQIISDRWDLTVDLSGKIQDE